MLIVILQISLYHSTESISHFCVLKKPLAVRLSPSIFRSDFFDLSLSHPPFPWQPVTGGPAGRWLINYCEKISWFYYSLLTRQPTSAAPDCEPAETSLPLIIRSSKAFVFNECRFFFELIHRGIITEN